MEQTHARTAPTTATPTSGSTGWMVNSSMGDGNIQAYNDDALAQQVVFQTSALPAEVSAGGVRANMIPKRRRQPDRGGFSAAPRRAGRYNNLTQDRSTRLVCSCNFVQHVQDFNFNMGGPIKKDKLWLGTPVTCVCRRGRRQLVLSSRLR